MIATEAVQRTVILVRKYWIYLFVPVFLLAAYIYVDNSHTRYKVTAKIILSDKAPADVIRELGSDQLIGKVISYLPSQVSYYDAESPRDEVYGDSLRIRMVFDHLFVSEAETELRLDYDGTGLVALTHIDTTAYYDFYQLVHESYGSFMLISKGNAVHRRASYIVKLQSQARVLADYHHNLRFEDNIGDGSVSVSFLTGNPKKGIDFLNGMLSLYQGSGSAGSRYASLNARPVHRSQLIVLERPENNIEQASLSPFWIYLIAMVAGLLTPVVFKTIRSRKTRSRRPQGFKLPKLVTRLQQVMPVKQLD